MKHHKTHCYKGDNPTIIILPVICTVQFPSYQNAPLFKGNHPTIIL